MTDKEEKAVEQFKYMNEEGCEKCVYEDDKTCVDCFDNHREILLNLIEKQEKIIQAMAKYIAGCDTDEDICKKMYPNNSCEDNGIPCWDCIIEYFEKVGK